MTATLTPSATATATLPNTGFAPLTEGDIVAGYAFKQQCYNLSSDSKLVYVGNTGVYDTVTGVRRFSVEGDYGQFSPDGLLLAISGNGVYEVSSGTRRFTISSGGFTFSPDSTLIAVGGDGVYETATGTRRFTIKGYAFTFSPDSQRIAVGGDGVYDVSTGLVRFPVTGYNLTFSPDSTLLAIGSDGVYDSATGMQRFPIVGPYPAFSPNGNLLAVGADGVYDVATGNRRFSIQGTNVNFSPDGTLLAANGVGIYDVESGLLRFAVTSEYSTITFSPNGNLFYADNGLYDVATNQKMFSGNAWRWSQDGTLIVSIVSYRLGDGMGSQMCLLFGSANNWPNHAGIIHIPARVNIRNTPNGEIVRTSNDETATVYGIEFTDYGDWWFKIGENEWVYFYSVEIQYQP